MNNSKMTLFISAILLIIGGITSLSTPVTLFAGSGPSSVAFGNFTTVLELKGNTTSVENAPQEPWPAPPFEHKFVGATALLKYYNASLYRT